MTQKEVREKLLDVEAPEWYKEVEVTFEFPACNIKETKKGFANIYEFVNRQVNGWDGLESIPDLLMSSKEYFQEIQIKLDQYLSDSQNWSQELHERKDYYNRNETKWNKVEYHILDNKSYVFLYNSSETEFILKINEINEHVCQGGYDYLINQPKDFNQQTHPSQYLSGILMGYEFRTKELDIFKKNRTQQKTQVNQLRSEYESFISQAEEQLNHHLKTNADALKSNLTETNEELTKHITGNDEFTQEQINGIDDYISNKKNEFEDWFSEINSNEKSFVDSSKKNVENLESTYKQSIKNLEITYQEKLRLEEPAKYWKKRAATLGISGKKWLYAMIACIAVALISLSCVLYFISDGTLKDLFEKTGSAIRWSIVFITFVSFLAYAMKTFAKLTFSAFHLARDAEEREQLAYFYLSLTKEREINETERHLIMQALFSRADTGLLKEDSSPSMPGGIIEKVIKGAGR